MVAGGGGVVTDTTGEDDRVGMINSLRDGFADPDFVLRKVAPFLIV